MIKAMVVLKKRIEFLEIHMMTEDGGRRARLIEVLVFDLMIGSISRHGFNEFIMLFSSTGST